MFEMARLVGTPLGKIILQTRGGRNVENSQSCEPDARISDCYNLFRRNHFAWVNRKPACGVYNRFGLVWASRRTSIYDESEIYKILTDDGYRHLAPDEQPQPGDLVLYLRRNGDTLRDTVHAAIVLELEKVGTYVVPRVLSKWSDVFGEDIHGFLDIPKNEYYRDCLIEFWTDRL
jgi:hypothetical protein